MEFATEITAIDTVTCACGVQPLMSVAEASAVISASKSYLYEGLREGRFPGLRLGDGYRMRADFVHGFVRAPAGTKFEDYAAEWMAREAQAVAS